MTRDSSSTLAISYRHSSASVSNDANIDIDSGDNSRPPPLSLDSLRRAFARYFEATSEASTAAEKASKASAVLREYYRVALVVE